MGDSYIYCFIRKDLSIAQQIIQMTHAGHEAGKRAADSPVASICLFEVYSEKELILVAGHLHENNIHYTCFFEDNKVGYTALCTEPIDAESDLRLIFQKYTLYGKT